jgi:hypothetical protein
MNERKQNDNIIITIVLTLVIVDILLYLLLHVFNIPVRQ